MTTPRGDAPSHPIEAPASTPEEERNLVAALATAMTEKLAANRGKRHWLDSSPDFLVGRLHAEVEELEQAIGGYLEEGSADEADVWREAADVANFAAMLAENATGPSENADPVAAARDEGRREANAEWNSKEGTVWHYDCGLDEALKQARDEGRQEAVRRIRDIVDRRVFAEANRDTFHSILDTVEGEVAGLNASESPLLPGQVRVRGWDRFWGRLEQGFTASEQADHEGHRILVNGHGNRWCHDCEAWVYYNPAGDASESPPTRIRTEPARPIFLGTDDEVGDARESPSTASCCGHFPHGNGPCHGMVTDWGGKRIPCDCDGQDASESGQPPDPEMTEANRESDADAWNSDR